MFIALTQGKTVEIDDVDAEIVSSRKWHAVNNGGHWYAASSEGHSRIYMHRFLIGEACSGVLVDHIDGNGLNNKRGNIRVANHSQNNANASSVGDRKFKGVFSIPGGKWIARLSIRSSKKYAGVFNNQHQAACAYNHLALLAQGEFARLNNTKAANDE